MRTYVQQQVTITTTEYTTTVTDYIIITMDYIITTLESIALCSGLVGTGVGDRGWGGWQQG